jgi:hypothetical protein
MADSDEEEVSFERTNEDGAKGGKARVGQDEVKNKKPEGNDVDPKVSVIVTEDPPTLTSCSSSDSDGKLMTEEGGDKESDKKEEKSAFEKLADNVKDTSGWGWNTLSTWGTSVFSTASSSVSTFTTQVGEGFHQVMETVESKLADPEPEEPEEVPSPGGSSTVESEPTDQVIDRAPEPHPIEVVDPVVAGEGGGEAEAAAVEDESGKQGWFAGWGASLSDVMNKTTSVVQHTVEQTTNVSKKVVSSGLDVLETIGKKTYDVIAEGDHGLKKTIERTRKNNPNLSQALREAKEEAEEKTKEEEAFMESRKCHYGAQFDDFQGLVQLEALEMLSSMSEGKVRGLLDILPREAADALRADLTRIKLTFEETSPDNDDDDLMDHDFHQLLMDYVGQLSLNVSIQKLLQSQVKSRQWLTEYDKRLKDDAGAERSPKEVHERAIQAMAEFTANSIEHFHRAGQLILQDKTIPVTLYPSMANSLSSLTKVLCKEITWQSTLFVSSLTASVIGSDEPVTETITNVYLEASNSSTYVQNGFQLLLPIIQLATIQAHPTCQRLAAK